MFELVTYFTDASISSPVMCSLLETDIVSFCLILSSRLYYRELPLKDNDSSSKFWTGIEPRTLKFSSEHSTKQLADNGI